MKIVRISPRNSQILLHFAICNFHFAIFNQSAILNPPSIRNPQSAISNPNPQNPQSAISNPQSNPSIRASAHIKVSFFTTQTSFCSYRSGSGRTGMFDYTARQTGYLISRLLASRSGRVLAGITIIFSALLFSSCSKGASGKQIDAPVRPIAVRSIQLSIRPIRCCGECRIAFSLRRSDRQL